MSKAAEQTSVHRAASRVIAGFAGESITADMLEHEMVVLAEGTLPAQKLQALRRRALSALITSGWVLAEAREQGVTVSEAAAREKFEEAIRHFYKGNVREAQKTLARTGKSVQDGIVAIELEAAVTGLAALIEGRTPKVSSSQVSAFYRHHLERYQIPEARQFRATITHTLAATLKIKHEVLRGRSFATLAFQTSASRPTAAEGNGMGNALERAIYTARPNVLTGPVKLRADYYLIEVTGIVPAHVETLAQATPAIAKQLRNTQIRRERTAFDKAWLVKWRARTSCRAGYVVPQCREFRGDPGVAARESSVFS